MTVDTRLLELLSTDIQSCTDLLALLEQEFAALNERQLDVLQGLLDKKQPLLSSLNQNAQERSNLLVQQQVTPDAEGFAAFSQQSAQREQLTQQHDQLHALLEQCQAANLRNGRLIRTNQVGVGTALNIIRGNNEPSLYDRSGSTAGKGTQRSFTRA